MESKSMKDAPVPSVQDEVIEKKLGAGDEGPRRVEFGGGQRPKRQGGVLRQHMPQSMGTYASPRLCHPPSGC